MGDPNESEAAFNDKIDALIEEAKKYASGAGPVFDPLDSEERFKEQEKIREEKEKEFRQRISEETGMDKREIAVTQEEALTGKFKYFPGNIFLDLSEGGKHIEDYKFPERVDDSVTVRGLKSAKGVKFPEYIYGLYLPDLITEEGLQFSDNVRILELDSLPCVKNIVFPEEMDILSLRGLRTADGLVCPKRVNVINLDQLETLKGWKQPEEIRDLLFAPGVITVDGLNPEGVNGIDIRGVRTLKTPDGIFKFSREMTGDRMNLSGIESPEDLVNLPYKIRNLWLNGLERHGNLDFSKIIVLGSLEMNEVKLFENFNFPVKIGGGMFIRHAVSIKDSSLPNEIKGTFDARNVKDISNSDLPRRISVDVYLNKLQSLNHRDLPEGIKGKIFLRSLLDEEKKDLVERYPNYKKQFVFN